MVAIIFSPTVLPERKLTILNVYIYFPSSLDTRVKDIEGGYGPTTCPILYENPKTVNWFNQKFTSIAVFLVHKH